MVVAGSLEVEMETELKLLFILLPLAHAWRTPAANHSMRG
jgi:hypothetical protein